MITVHVFVRADSADQAAFAVYDDASTSRLDIVGTPVILRVETSRSALNIAESLADPRHTTVALPGEGKALFHIIVKVR